MKKITLIAAALFSIAAQAHAVNLTGTWKGAGRAVDNSGKTINCESVVLTINHTATSFSVNSDFVCDGNAIQIPGGAMEIRGNEIFDKGVKAGTITDNNISVMAKAKGYAMQSNASFTQNAMNLHSVVAVGNNPAPALTFDAQIRR